MLDADSSQNYAINAVLAGRNLIIKGPPGTGKSQTISNLVSTLVARGKRVLFVAEKRAAIDAVLRRLNDVGLGDLVLDLHGGVSSRRQTAEALTQALRTNAALAKPKVERLHGRLSKRREELNARVEALHRPREPWEISFFEAQTGLLGLPERAATEVQFRGSTLEGLNADVITQLGEDLEAYVGLGGLILARSRSPWARATVVSQEEAQGFDREVESVRRALQALVADLEAAARAANAPRPSTLSGWRQQLNLWQRCATLMESWEPELFGLDLGKLIPDTEPLERSAAARASAAITSAPYRAAKKTLRAALRTGVKLSPRACREAAQEASSLLADWQAGGGVASAPPIPPANLAELIQTFEALYRRLYELATRLGTEAPDGDAAALVQWLEALLADVPTLSKLPELHRLRTEMLGAGLEELLNGIDGSDLGREEAAQVLRYAWLRSIVRHLELSDTVLGAFDGEQHREVVAEFQKADREHIESTPERVRRLCAEQAVAIQDAQPENGALVRAEAAKKRKHLPIRQLFSAAPDVLTSLRPCWVMSPLVVSQVLPSDQPYFDVVIFDEASQVRPAEAMPAILRGKQLVVAGDERQLPPTSFFTGNNPEAEDEELEASGALTIDASYESILEGLAAFVNFRMLEWHYRSRDERLITFSNVHLYHRSLTTFPGIELPECISHVAVPYVPGEVGSETSAAGEVNEVVERIIEHSETRPEQSLAVIAMGIKHANRIDEALRTALHDRDDLEEFFAEDRHEPFFIKNLERVQGDERDAIILSVGYGKTADGRLLYRFGPLNQEGGERRLNVAVTRAKQRMTLVSSFTHQDMDPDHSSARGVQLLRAYLEYCASNGSKLSEDGAAIAKLNPFEVDVRDSLERAGIPVVAQYGASGYRIDFAAKHPSQPGRMILAIETDGATYHSSESARDRDRLRQEHLERLGWTFHRIWSQDWFNDREREIARVKTTYEAAIETAEKADERAAEERANGRAEQRASTPPKPRLPGAVDRGKCPICTGRASIDGYTRGQLVKLIRWIESDTLLRTPEQLLEEAMAELGFRRKGKKIVEALNRAIDAAR